MSAPRAPREVVLLQLDRTTRRFAIYKNADGTLVYRPKAKLPDPVPHLYEIWVPTYPGVE